VGLGNNGGSKTIIRCAETLSILGAKVFLFTNIPNKYTWHSISGTKIIYGDRCPKCDVEIATGYNSISNVLSSSNRKKFCYIRGWEIWQANEKKLLEAYKNINCIVNSEWLKIFLSKRCIISEIVYPGLDFNIFVDNEQNPKMYQVGALFSKRHSTKRHIDAKKIVEYYKLSSSFLNEDIKNIYGKNLREWYNKIKVWFAPTELEGLHNPPMEASLCGCGLVCCDHKMSGMSDYAMHNLTALVYPARNIKVAAKYVLQLLEDDNLRELLNKNMKEILRDKIGSRETNMKHFLDVIK
jgi:hypothetical protein